MGASYKGLTLAPVAGPAVATVEAPAAFPERTNPMANAITPAAAADPMRIPTSFAANGPPLLDVTKELRRGAAGGGVMATVVLGALVVVSVVVEVVLV